MNLQDPDNAEIAEMRQLWEAASLASPTHGYLVRKGVGAYGIRQCRGALLIPARTIDGSLVGVQRIYPNGAKRFVKGTKKTAAMHVVGDWNAPILVVEGYATASSCFEATRHCTVVAFDAGNLMAVGKAIRSKYPGLRIFFVADDDANGVGVRAATEAALSVDGDVLNPSLLIREQHRA